MEREGTSYENDAARYKPAICRALIKTGQSMDIRIMMSRTTTVQNKGLPLYICISFLVELMLQGLSTKRVGKAQQ